MGASACSAQKDMRPRGGTCSLQSRAVELTGTERGRRRGRLESSTREPWNPKRSRANERPGQHSSRPTR